MKRRQAQELALAGVLWSAAGALLYIDLAVLPSLVSPLAAGLDDGTALYGLAHVGAIVFFPSLLTHVLFILAPALIWNRFELRLATPLAPVLAYLAMGTVGLRPLLAFALPMIAAFTILIYLCDRQGEAAQRWLYWTLPATAATVAAGGALYVWLCWHVLREPAGVNPRAALALFVMFCLAVALPALLSFKSLIARGALLLAAAWFVSQHSFDANFPIRAPERLLGDSEEHPNVFLIVVDTLRADMLSYRDPQAPATPAIDRLASESVSFANAISPSSWTFPSMTSLMTGVAPLKSREQLGRRVFRYPTIPRATIAETLSANGYRTRAIVGNHLLCRPFQVAAGFDRIDTYANNTFGENNLSNLMIGAGERANRVHSLQTRQLTNKAIEHVQRLEDGSSSFLWLHYFDPHDPYLPPAEFVDPESHGSSLEVERQKRRYGGEVRFIDSEIGRFLAALRERGLYDNSIIIFTSDHGEGFLEHGETLHGFDLFQEVIHVPLLIRVPGIAPKTVEDYVPTNALLPTVLDLLALNEPAAQGWPASLSPLILSADQTYEDPVLSGANNRREPQWSVILNNMKYIYLEQTGREEVYDLAADPDELRSMEHPPEAFLVEARAALADHLKFAEKALQDAGLAGNEDANTELLDRMKSLGYIQ